MSKDFEDMWKDFENWNNSEAWSRIQKDYDVNHLFEMIDQHRTVYEPKVAKRRIEPKPKEKIGLDLDKLEAGLNSLADAIDLMLDDIYLYKRDQDN